MTCTSVGDNSPIEPIGAGRSGVWAIERHWNQGWENVFSYWIFHLFRPISKQQNKGWRRLHDVLHNPQRNLLFNQLGLAEDDPLSTHSIRAVADCGDLPYQLRAYFAWKFGLPFRFNVCSRGSGTDGPVCSTAFDNRIKQFDTITNQVERFNRFLRVVAWKVHSGTFRTLSKDETSDFYPIALSRAAIRPGTVFVDSGGHILMITQWDALGLYAVDGHPDKTVTRRPFKSRFFPYYPALKTGGFKAFRPFHSFEEQFVPVSNKALSQSHSVMQYQFAQKGDFYKQMNRLIKAHSNSF